jgi:hypothetical protein
MGITYRGVRFGDGHCVVTRDCVKLDPRLDLFDHSPTGLEWGYGGSGPAQTALAVLADFLQDDELAVLLHQKFKWEVIAKLPRKRWSINEPELRAALKRYAEDQGSPVYGMVKAFYDHYFKRA